MNQFRKTFGMISIVIALVFTAGCSSSGQMEKQQSTVDQASQYSYLNLDTVKAGRFDTGRMWTFDYPPVKYFESQYNFKPSEKWLKNVRMSALRFANYCSASFISADGLVMTNHHCGRESVAKVSKPGEDLFDNGFYAKTLDEERKVPGLYVDQLVQIKDVTEQIHTAMDSGKTAEDKASLAQKEMNKIKKADEEKTGLKIQIVKFYNGGKYSEYQYKRYNDVRLVFSPEAQLGYFGGDEDNFTYPRYDLDMNFFRVYDDNGKPLKTEHYFHWSPNGAVAGEPVFVIGNPGRTDRLKTVSQLEYMRDIQYPRTLKLVDDLANNYLRVMKEHPDRKTELTNDYFEMSNSQKAYTGMLKGLRNPVLMQKKIDFENKFKEAVNANPTLKAKYGDLWGKIAEKVNELRKVSNENYALSINPFFSTKYIQVAQNLVDLAEQLKLPEDQRADMYKGAELDSTIADIFPKDFDYAINNLLLKEQIQRLVNYIGADDPLVQKVTQGKSVDAATEYLINNSPVTNPERMKALIKEGPDAILNSSDPLIYYVKNSVQRRTEMDAKVKDIVAEEDNYSQLLGRAIFEVYGTSIPPDATFTLRIADGVVKGYPYNGTVAPDHTTFYGLYDRYYSFNKKGSWTLPKRWQNPPADFNLETPMDFVSTNDIIGGNSGSPVINEKAQIVGLAFDGNIQSLPGNFIFDPSNNRCVAVHSAGMYEAIKDMYKATRLADELKAGEIVDTTSKTATESK